MPCAETDPRDIAVKQVSVLPGHHREGDALYHGHDRPQRHHHREDGLVPHPVRPPAGEAWVCLRVLPGHHCEVDALRPDSEGDALCQDRKGDAICQDLTDDLSSSLSFPPGPPAASMFCQRVVPWGLPVE